MDVRVHIPVENLEYNSLFIDDIFSIISAVVATSPKTGGGANRNQEIETTQTKDKQPDKLDWEEIVQSMGDFYKHKYHTYCYHFSTPPTEEGPEFGVAFDDDPGMTNYNSSKLRATIYQDRIVNRFHMRLVKGHIKFISLQVFVRKIAFSTS